MRIKKALKITAIALASVIGAAVLAAGAYVAYVLLQYYRIEDDLALEVSAVSERKAVLGEEMSVLTYNLGFGAYSPEYSFFLDTGVMNDGREVRGIYAKGMSKEDVQKNLDGQIKTAAEADADFCLFQEVDERAHRSYKIDMRKGMTDGMNGYANTYAEYFHTAYLLYPFGDPMGSANAGLLTLSKFEISSATRRSFPVTDHAIDKLFDLDRCFVVHYLPVEGTDKMLVLINLHMSAYDKGGTIRAKQLEMLNKVLSAEREKGNYVIAGGDFNHCLIADEFESEEEALTHFSSEQRVPEWVKNSVLHKSDLAEGFSIAADKVTATCRGADIPYEKGVNYTTTVDGFIVSDNVLVTEVKTVDTDYAYSDHNPVKLTFELLG